MLVAASRDAPIGTSTVMPPVAAVTPSARIGIPAATVALVQVQAPQSLRIASISNDNRQSKTRTARRHIHRNVIVNSSA